MEKTNIELMNDSVNALFLELPESIAQDVQIKWQNVRVQLEGMRKDMEMALEREKSLEKENDDLRAMLAAFSKPTTDSPF